MRHVIAWQFWSFLFNRRQGVSVSHRVIKLSLLPSVMNTLLISRFHPISSVFIRSHPISSGFIRFLKFIGFVFGFSCFVRDEWFVPTGFRSLLLGNCLDHFLLFICSILIINIFNLLRIFCLFTPVFAIILLLNWKENRLPPLLPKLLSHLTYN